MAERGKEPERVLTNRSVAERMRAAAAAGEDPAPLSAAADEKVGWTAIVVVLLFVLIALGGCVRFCSWAGHGISDAKAEVAARRNADEQASAAAAAATRAETQRRSAELTAARATPGYYRSEVARLLTSCPAEADKMTTAVKALSGSGDAVSAFEAASRAEEVCARVSDPVEAAPPIDLPQEVRGPCVGFAQQARDVAKGVKRALDGAKTSELFELKLLLDKMTAGADLCEARMSQLDPKPAAAPRRR